MPDPVADGRPFGPPDANADRTSPTVDCSRNPGKHPTISHPQQAITKGRLTANLISL
jgi:hypothetical protein